MRLTDSVGVDVVLNSLAGEAMQRSLGLVKPFGRFLELGKRDFYENTAIGLRPFRHNVTYFGIDADQLPLRRPALASELFGEISGLMASGDRDGVAELLLDSIARNRDWNDGAARKRLLTLFEATGLEDPWVSAQRRRLSAVLFG